MTETMQAAVYRGSRKVQVEEVPVPRLLRGELLVRVAVCGVCGTDLKKIEYGLVDPPRIFGHETAGTVESVGEGVLQWKPGDRVAINHHVPCLKPDCFYCSRQVFAQCPVYKRTGITSGFEPAGGGYAKFVRVMDWCAESGTVQIPDENSFEEASFVEPLNTCLKGIKQARLRAGDTVFIVGQGPIGLLFTMLASSLGARVIVADLVPFRREEALRRGAVIALDPADPDYSDALAAAAKSFSSGRGADLSIVAVPATQVISKAVSVLRPGGQTLLFAQTRLNDPVEVDAGAICMLEKSIIGSYSSDVTIQQEAADLIFSRKIDVRGLITHRYPLERIEEAIKTASHPGERSLKVVVTP